MFQSLLHALDHHASARGEKVFTRHLVGDKVEELTFDAFRQRAVQVANHLRSAGCDAGDVVLIFLPTSPDVLAAFVGAMMLRAVPSLMPLPSAKQHPSIYWSSHGALLDRIQPRILLTDDVHAGQMVEQGLDRGRRITTIEQVAAETRSGDFPVPSIDDVALLQHSSGTTSLKKGVMLSHRAILRQVESYAARLDATTDDAIASWLPVYHDMGLIACSMMPLVLGQTVTIVSPFHWVARPAILLDALDRYDGAFAWLPNFAFEHLARAVPEGWRGDLSRVKAFVNCSEPCKPDTFDRFRARFAANGLRPQAMQVCYAMAETVFAVSQTPRDRPVRVVEVDRELLQVARRAASPRSPEQALGLLSNGPVIDGLDVTIRDPDSGAECGPNEVGEIVIRGAFLFDGYYNAPDITAERLRETDYFTRDMGFLRDGELYVLGRRDDLIIVNGRNLHAHEVEAIVGDVPGLKPGRAVAFGVYSEVNASEELVIVAERDGTPVQEAEAVRLIRERVFDQTNIDVKDVSVVEPGWLVKTTSGKISREKNRDKYLADQRATVAQAIDPGVADDSFSVIAQIIARLFRVPAKRITRATVAADVSGWDSLAHSTLILEIEKTLGITFPDAEIFDFADVGAIADRAAALHATGAAAPSRTILDTDDVAIVRMGEAGQGPDLVIFAAAVKRLGGEAMMDFASTLSRTEAQGLRKFFVTDKSRHWFTDSFDAIAGAINSASDRPKIVIGTSMGGYGALSVAPRLENVISILSFVPQPAPPRKVAREIGRTGSEWFVQPAPDVPTCIIFGELDDERGKVWTAKTFTDPAWQRVLTVPNCGHNVVRYLNKRGTLAEVLLAALEPGTMFDRLAELVGGIAPSAEELDDHLKKIEPFKARRALVRQAARREAKGLPAQADADADAAEQRCKRRQARKDRATGQTPVGKVERQGSARKERLLRSEKRPRAGARRLANPRNTDL